jgi:hypothetical protein
MEGLVLMGIFYIVLALLWVVWLAPKQTRQRRERMQKEMEEKAKANADLVPDNAPSPGNSTRETGPATR